MADINQKIFKMEKLLSNLLKINDMIKIKEIDGVTECLIENNHLIKDIATINEQLVRSKEKMCETDEEKMNVLKQAILVQNKKNMDELSDIKINVHQDLKVMNQKVAASVAYNNMRRLSY